MAAPGSCSDFFSFFVFYFFSDPESELESLPLFADFFWLKSELWLLIYAMSSEAPRKLSIYGESSFLFSSSLMKRDCALNSVDGVWR